ncbi:MAG: family hydrolase [Marmoricola sp.]|nr:family hydrolase [Marmoricola sp.]
MEFDTAVLDVDGTLVDSNYQHVIAWQRAFAEAGLAVPGWRIHRAIGMGGERLVAHVAGDAVETEHGDRIRKSWEGEVDTLLAEIVPFDGATALLDALHDLGLTVVLATSGKPKHTEHALDVLDARTRIDHLVTSADVDASKPAPDLLTVAREAVDGVAAFMVGDSVWDAYAAAGAGLPMLGLLSGGFGRNELTAAGARDVCDGPDELRAQLPAALDLLAGPVWVKTAATNRPTEG